MHFTLEQLPTLQKHFMQIIPKMTLSWQFSVPPSNLRDEPLQLLTIAGVTVTGVWQGGFGEHYVGWTQISAVTVLYSKPTVQ